MTNMQQMRVEKKIVSDSILHNNRKNKSKKKNCIELQWNEQNDKRFNNKLNELQHCKQTKKLRRKREKKRNE